MTEIIYRLDPERRDKAEPPADAAAACQRLLDGNRRFVDFFAENQVIDVAPEEIGISIDGGIIPQAPFAAILGCADARVPTELVFRCPSNAVFVVRVAGNVAGDECMGSLEYAVSNLAESLRVIIVLGHTGCGAVGAAVSSYLDPTTYPASSPHLRSVIDRILPAVRTADNALAGVHGGRTATTEGGRGALNHATVVLNAALVAAQVHADLEFPVQYGFFDLENREVELAEPPANPAAFTELADAVARSKRITRMLGS